jgi:hypothetical protein
MSNLRYDIQRFAAELDAQDNAAFDLWSWLPSHKAAKKAHGDYADEHTPSAADIMREAAVVLAAHAGYPPSKEVVEEWYGCPCGECEHARGKPIDKK